MRIIGNRLLDLLKSLRVTPIGFRNKRVDLLLVCAEQDLSEKINNKRYARQLYSFGELCERENLRTMNFLLPFSRLKSQEIWNYGSSGNSVFVFLKLIGPLFKFLNIQFLLDELEIKYYLKFLTRIGVRFVAGIGLPQSLLIASKQLEIESLEIAHGYGYTELPVEWLKKDSVLPNHIMVFDPKSADTFSKLGVARTNVVISKNFWIDRFKSNELNLSVDESWLTQQDGIQRDKKIVLVSLQWGYDGEVPYFDNILPNGLFPEQLLEVIAKTRNTCFWIFRLHPVHLAFSRYRKHKSLLKKVEEDFSNVSWNDSCYTPLPTLLRHCDAHVTMSSMSAYEAAFLGVRTILLCPTLQNDGVYCDMFAEIKDMGLAEIVDLDAEKIFDRLNSIDSKIKAFEGFECSDIPIIQNWTSSKYGLVN